MGRIRSLWESKAADWLMLMFLAVILGLWTAFIQARQTQEVQIAACRQQMENVQSSCRQAKRLRQDIDELERQNRILRHVAEQRSEWAADLEAVGSCRPAGVRLTRIAMSQGKEVEISGEGVSAAQEAEWVAALESGGHFESTGGGTAVYGLKDEGAVQFNFSLQKIVKEEDG